MSDAQAQGGNGCLYLIGAVGVLCVLAGLAWDRLPELDFDDEEETMARGLELPESPPSAMVVEPEPALPPPPPPAAPMPVEPVEVTPVLWHAERVGHTGLASQCVIVLELNRRLDGPAALGARVECGEEVLFEGLVGRQDLSELSLGVRGFAYRASVSALGRGDRFGQTALTLTSSRRRATITAPGRTVELYVEDLSIPRVGDPFFVRNQVNPPRPWAPARRRALVRTIEGSVPPAIANARQGRGECSVSVHPAMSTGELSCRIVVRCGGAVIYGADQSGYNRCVIEDDTVVSARDVGFSDVDTDPDLDLDFVGRRLVVSDRTFDGIWSATFVLDDERSCDAEPVTYAGRALGEPPVELSFDPGEPAGLLHGLDAYRLQPVLADCHAGELIYEGDQGTLALTRGIEGATVAGTWTPVTGPSRAVFLSPL